MKKKMMTPLSRAARSLPQPDRIDRGGSGSEAGSYLRLIDFVYHSIRTPRVRACRSPSRPDTNAAELGPSLSSYTSILGDI